MCLKYAAWFSREYYEAMKKLCCFVQRFVVAVSAIVVAAKIGQAGQEKLSGMNAEEKKRRFAL